MLSTKATSSRNRKKQTSIENNCKFTPHSPGLQTYEAPEDRAGLPALIRKNPCGPLAELSIPHPETLPVWTIPRPSLSRKVSLVTQALSFSDAHPVFTHSILHLMHTCYPVPQVSEQGALHLWMPQSTKQLESLPLGFMVPSARQHETRKPTWCYEAKTIR